MSISRYQSKRNFKQTPEPSSGNSDIIQKSKKLSFVVQRHYASRLHYDFRLELDGVLKSWAIPKGPSMNPEDKRLAVMVEDHPYDYKDFEGMIPAGNYGAGYVYIWDKGYYEPDANEKTFNVLRKELKNGDLKFILHGKKLKGSFALVKMKDSENNWLLIKHKDEYAADEPYDSENYVPAKIIALKNPVKQSKKSDRRTHKSN